MTKTKVFKRYLCLLLSLALILSGFPSLIVAHANTSPITNIKFMNGTDANAKAITNIKITNTTNAIEVPIIINYDTSDNISVVYDRDISVEPNNSCTVGLHDSSGNLQNDTNSKSTGITIHPTEKLQSGTITFKVKTGYDTNAEVLGQATLTINGSAEVTTPPTANTLFYNGSEQDLITEGSATNGKLVYALGTETEATSEYSTTIPKGINVDTYYVWYKAVCNDEVNFYNDSEANHVAVIISNGQATCTPPTAKILSYTGEEQTLINDGSATNGTIKYALGENDTDAPTSGWDTEAPKGTNATTYYVWYKVEGSTNYNGVDPQCITVEISKLKPTITTEPSAKTLEYNGSAQTLINTGVVTNGTFQYALGTETEVTGTYSETAPTETNAGTYYVWYKVVGDTGYNNIECTTPITINIGQKTPTAEDFDITQLVSSGYTYTGNPISAIAPTAKNGIIGIGNITVYYNNGLGRTSVAPTEVGNYIVDFDVATGTNYGIANNIEIGTLKINRAEPTMTFASSTINKSNLDTTPFTNTLTYNGTGTVTYSSDSNDVTVDNDGLVTIGEIYENKTVTITATATANGNYLGKTATYTINITPVEPQYWEVFDNTLADSTNLTPNYDITNNGHTITYTNCNVKAHSENPTIGRVGADYWIGVKVKAPEQVTQENMLNTQYYFGNTGTWTTVESEGDMYVRNNGIYFDAWLGISTPDKLVNALTNKNGLITYTLHIRNKINDTDTISIIIDCKNLTLYGQDGETVEYKVVDGKFIKGIFNSDLSENLIGEGYETRKTSDNKYEVVKYATITEVPTIVTDKLVYSGTAQTLVNEGTAGVGAIEYVLADDMESALASTNWSNSAPSGTDVGDYTIWYRANGTDLVPTTPVSLTKSIVEKPITITGLTATNRQYDGTNVIAISGTPTLSGVLTKDTENVTLNNNALTASIQNATVGQDLAVTFANDFTISGTKANNYVVTQPTLTVNITPREVTVSGIVAENKDYDGTTTATFNTTNATLTGKIENDTLTISSVVGSFSDENAGENKTITITEVTLSDTTNYTVISFPTTTTATINKATLTDFAVSLDNWSEGTTVPTPIITGNIGNGLVSYAYKSATDTEAQFVNEIPTVSGDYIIQATVAETTNYLGKTATDTFSIGHTHILTHHDRVEANCVNTGTVEYWSCSGCNKNFADANGQTELDTIVINALGHNLTKIDATDSTCSEHGNYEYYKCSRCNLYFADENGQYPYTEAQTIKPLASHTLEAHDAVEATCTTDGNIAYWTCSGGCGKIFKDATATEEATIEEITIARGHNLTAHEAVEATCTETGNVEYWSCDKCNKNFADANATTEITDITIPAKGHTTLVLKAEVPATCTSTGTVAHYECNDCHKAFTDATGTTEIPESLLTIAKLPHHIVPVSAVEPTCTDVGNIAHYKCDICNTLYSDANGTTEITESSVILPSKGHDLTRIKRVEPTCEEDGNIEYYECDTCHKYFKNENNIRVEIEKSATVLPKLGHNSSTLVKVARKEAKIGVKGNIEHYKCEICGKLYEDNMGKHELTASSVVIPALPKMTLSSTIKTTGLSTYYAWTGSAVKPTIKVINKSTNKTLKLNTDYTIKYTNNINAGKATITITGKGDYTGTIKKYFTIVKPTLKYRGYVQKNNWDKSWQTATIGTTTNTTKFAGTKSNLRLQATQMKLTTSTQVSGQLYYRFYRQKTGWTKWGNGKDMTVTGNKTDKLRNEVIQIKLTGTIGTLYDVYYRVYTDAGWSGWAKNSAKAGSTGYGRKIRNVQVQLVPKGTTFNTGTKKAYLSK